MDKVGWAVAESEAAMTRETVVVVRLHGSGVHLMADSEATSGRDILKRTLSRLRR